MRKIFLFTSILSLVSIHAYSQNIGIGTITPLARLDVMGIGSASTTNNLMLRNSIGDTLVRVLNDGRMNVGYNGSTLGRTLNIGGNGVDFYKTDVDFGGAIFPTDTSVIMWSQTGDNRYVILQPTWGNVGIGTFGPKAKFHVLKGSSGATPASDAVSAFESNLDASLNLLTPNNKSSAVYFGNPTNSRQGGIVYNSAVANGLDFRTNGNVTRMVISSTGNVGIADNTPSARLDIKGSDGSINNHIRLEDNNTSDFSNIYYTGDLNFRNNKVGGDFYFRDDAGTPVLSLFDTGNLTIAGTLTQNSDIRLKQNIEPLQSSLDKLLHLTGYHYYWKPELNKDHSLQTGLIAQEVEQVFPELVRTDAEGMKSVNYSGMIPYVIEAFKEQQAIISSQQIKFDAQQLKLEDLEKEVHELKSLLMQMTASK